MTYPNQESNPPSTNWPARLNENLSALDEIFAFNYATSSGLTFGYFGGAVDESTTVANGTVALTASNTNYVVAHRTTGVVSAATSNTNWNNTTTYGRIHRVVAGGSTITSRVDWRKKSGGFFQPAGGSGGVGDVVGPASSTDSHFAQFDGITGKLLKGGLALDTDGTLAANSNTRVPSQAAMVTYVAARITALIASAPGALDELAAALGDDANFASTVTTALAAKAPLASPTFTGNPAAPTPSPGDNDTSIATTAFVTAAIAAIAGYTPNVQSVTSSSTVTPTFSNDIVKITAQAAALALANPSGTAVEGWGIVIRIKDNGTARAISYGTQYRAIGVTLPTTTVISKTVYLACIWNDTDTKLDVVGVGQEA